MPGIPLSVPGILLAVPGIPLQVPGIPLRMPGIGKLELKGTFSQKSSLKGPGTDKRIPEIFFGKILSHQAPLRGYRAPIRGYRNFFCKVPS